MGGVPPVARSPGAGTVVHYGQTLVTAWRGETPHLWMAKKSARLDNRPRKCGAQHFTARFGSAPATRRGSTRHRPVALGELGRRGDALDVAVWLTPVGARSTRPWQVTATPAGRRPRSPGARMQE
jgi:hypothetical protein